MNDQERAQLDDLQGQVAGLVEKMAQVARASEEVGAESEAVTAAVSKLEETVAAVATERPGPGPVKAPPAGGEEPRAWVDYATADDWVELADWVDWLIATYDLSGSYRIDACWPAHTGVAEELAALWSAWKAAAVAARAEDGDALAFWHDRYLATLLARLNTTHGIRACHGGRHSGPFHDKPTDRTLIDVRSAAVAADEMPQAGQRQAEQDRAAV